MSYLGLLDFAVGPAVGPAVCSWEERAMAISPILSSCLGIRFPSPPALSFASFYLFPSLHAFLFAQLRHYCRRFIFRVKATELQIRQALKQIDERKVFVFEAVWMRDLLAEHVKKLLSWFVFQVGLFSELPTWAALFLSPRSERRLKHKKQLKSHNLSPVRSCRIRF